MIVTEKLKLILKIKELLCLRNSTLVAHYYVNADIQDLAVDTDGIVSDSLEMAKFGTESKSQTLVVAGVRFMGETAKILNPEKRVLMPTLKAECSLDLGCPIAEFSRFCEQHPERTVVVYANTSAAVKARADWVVTSGIALDVIRYLHNCGKKILWAPDKHLGAYIQKETGADMLLWNASCVVHDSFKAEGLRKLKEQFPEAAVLVHPESPLDVIDQATVVGSTTAIVEAARTLPHPIFIVATDNGIFHKLRQVAPDKIFIEAPTAGKSATCESCNHCPWMALNSLHILYQTLLDESNEILIEEEIRKKALVPIQRLLTFAKERKQIVLGNNDA